MGLTPLFYAHGGWRVSHTSPVSWKKLILTDPCPYCCLAPRADFGKHRITIEHVTPKSEGGTGEWGNLVGAHEGCNQQRSSHSLLLFLIYRQRMAAIRGKKGTPNRKERARFRRAFWSHGRRGSHEVFR